MADFCALLRFFKAKDSASPGWLQPISLRETLLSEKWSSTLRVCLMADFCALAAAAGARASCVGPTWRRKRRQKKRRHIIAKYSPKAP